MDIGDKDDPAFDGADGDGAGGGAEVGAGGGGGFGGGGGVNVHFGGGHGVGYWLIGRLILCDERNVVWTEMKLGFVFWERFLDVFASKAW